MADEVTLPASALPPEGGKEYLEKMLARADAPMGDDHSVVDDKGVVKPVTEQAPEPDKRYKDLQAQFTKVTQELAALKKKPAAEAPKPPEKTEGAQPPEKKEGEEAPEKKVEDKADEVEVPPEAQDAKALTDKAGLDWTAVNTEFAQRGQLSDQSYEKLEAVGITRDMVDQYTAGQVALQKTARAEMLTSVGGEEGYGKVVEWAKDALTKDELTAYNKIVTGSDREATKMAIAGLKDRMDKAEGIDPKLVQGGPSNVVGFQSMAELKAAIKDPRYGKDPVYRRSVEQKTLVSRFK